MNPLLRALTVIALLGLSSNAFGPAKDNNVEWDDLFSDQGPLYMNPTEPTSGSPVVLRLGRQFSRTGQWVKPIALDRNRVRKRVLLQRIVRKRLVRKIDL